MDSFRKAYGALKDSTKVGLAKVNNSHFKELDIAIVKATNHEECPPKERHVRKIFAAVLVSCPRADVGYCIYALSKRLEKTRSWIVAIKTLIVFHRILREGDPSFREQLMHFSRRGNLFQVTNFKDDSAWDCSAYVRTYAIFIEERVECSQKLNFDVDADRGIKSASEEQCDVDLSNPNQLLDHLPVLQQLLYRLLCCQPEGTSCGNFLIQYSFSLVVQESFKVYCAINDRIVNLVDKYFEMPKHEATKALDIYKRAGRQADQLADFYNFCRTLELAQTFHFPILRQPPPSFLATMEEYIKEAPQPGSGSDKKMDQQDEKEEPEKEAETKKEVVHLEEKPAATEIKQVNPPPVFAQEPVDLLGLNEVCPEAVQLDESHRLALAIVQPGNGTSLTNSSLMDSEKASSWELALVTQSSNMSKQVAEAKMVGGFDKCFLDSLYEDNASRRQLQMHSAGYSTGHCYEAHPQNLFDQRDPFLTSNAIAPQTNVQMTMMSQQQLFMQQQQMMIQKQQQQLQLQEHMMIMQQRRQQQQNMTMMVPSDPYTATLYSQQHQRPPQMWSANPFGDSSAYPSYNAMTPSGSHPSYNAMTPNGSHTLL